MHLCLRQIYANIAILTSQNLCFVTRFEAPKVATFGTRVPSIRAQYIFKKEPKKWQHPEHGSPAPVWGAAFCLFPLLFLSLRHHENPNK